LPVAVPVGETNWILRATSSVNRYNDAKIGCCNDKAKPGSIPQINQIKSVICSIHFLHLIIIKFPKDPEPLAKWVKITETRTPATFTRFLDDVSLLHYRFLN
jgi:hypothetical protein